MKRSFNLSVFFVCAIFLVLGCRGNPVLNIDDAPIEVSGSGEGKSIKKAIIRAGASLGWAVKDVGPGHLTATLFLRKHMAKVDIFYSATKYSIKYKDSQHLNYDGTNIHKNYNSWVTNLNNKIQVQLSAM